MSPFEIIQVIASGATALGVAVAAWQLYHTKRDAQAQFEEGLNEQYRSIAHDIPLQALLGKELAPSELEEYLRAFYNYFDLSNEQAFLASKRRLRRATWSNWREGIEQHFTRPAFQKAWERLSPDLDGSFDDLRRVIGTFRMHRATKLLATPEDAKGPRSRAPIVEDSERVHVGRPDSDNPYKLS